MICQYSENCEHYVQGIKEHLCRDNYMNCILYKERKQRISDEERVLRETGCFSFEIEKGLLELLR